ncbi:S41 family peptidase [Paenibacillus sp. BAC0078]
MKNKWTTYALPLLAVIMIAAAVFFTTKKEKALPPLPSSAPTAQAVSSPQPSAASTPVPDEKKLTPEQMKADLNFLVQTLAEMHPRLINGWNVGEKKVIAEAYSKIRQPQTPGEFYFIADEIVSLLHDGHTYIYSFSARRLLDLPLYWSREGLVVTEDRGVLKTGDIVTAIGNRSINELEQELAKAIPAENKQWVREQGTTFVISDIFLNHLGLTRDNQATVQVKRGVQNVEGTFTFTSDNSGKFYNPYPGAETDVNYYFDKKLPLGVFELTTCNYDDHYVQMVKDFFAEVNKRGIRYIAVDLRNNGGGDSRVVDEFMSYLKVKSYRTYGAILRFSPQVHAAYGGQESGTAKYAPSVTDNPLKTAQPFKGKLYILTSPRSFSSANMFAVTVQDNQLGLILGEATGNKPSSYGDVLPFKLPSSGLEFQVSFKNFTRPNPKLDPADAVFPDIEAYTTVKDIIKRRDAQMEKLREVVEENLQTKVSK